MLKPGQIGNILGAVALTLIAVWWLFFISWQLGFIRAVQALAFRFEPATVATTAIFAATQRAYTLATVGTTGLADIFFTAEEVSHLNDVSHLFQPLRLSFGLSALIAFAGLIVILGRRKRLPSPMFLYARNILLIACLFTFLALLLFPVFFIALHQIMFPQGNWAFPETSVLINLFPETFWKLMLGWYVAGALLTAFVYHLAARAND